jgi:hypothetical protein
MASRSDPLTITSYGDGIGFRRLAVGGGLLGSAPADAGALSPTAWNHIARFRTIVGRCEMFGGSNNACRAIGYGADEIVEAIPDGMNKL